MADTDIAAEALARRLVAPVTAGRIRGIARQWVRADAPANVTHTLELLAAWLDDYHAALGETLASREIAEGPGL